MGVREQCWQGSCMAATWVLVVMIQLLVWEANVACGEVEGDEGVPLIRSMAGMQGRHWMESSWFSLDRCR